MVLQDFQNFMTDVNQKKWRNFVTINENKQYVPNSVNNSIKGQKRVMSQTVSPVNFQNPDNLKQFIEQRAAQLKDLNKDKKNTLKDKINGLINELYDKILDKAI